MTDLSEQTRAHLHRTLAASQHTGRVPGIAAGVARDGALVWSDGVGAGDLAKPAEAPTPDTQFLIASNSKTFTAVLVMALRDEGKLTLDDTVDQHVPESKHAGITIRQLLTHITGMQREPVGDVWDTLTFPDRVALVDGWNAAEQILRPNHKWHYSNLGFSVLGEIVARLDGREWAESLQARILDPLEMRRTTVGLAENAAVGYYVAPFSDVPIVEPVLDIASLAPAGGMASTLTDMATWGSFLADPVAEVLSTDTLEEMCQPQIMADLEGWTLAWGLGLMLVRAKDRVWVGHTGAMPGHITGLLVHRKTNTVGITLMNSTSAPDPAGLAIELGRLRRRQRAGRVRAVAAGHRGPRRAAGRPRPVVLRGQAVQLQRAARAGSRPGSTRLSRRPRRRCSCSSATTSTAPSQGARPASCFGSRAIPPVTSSS